VKRRADIAGFIGKAVVVLVLIGGVAIIGESVLRWNSPDGGMTGSSGGGGLNSAGVSPVSESAIVMREKLSPLAAAGKELFEAHCAACHGPKANGKDHGPPFVNDIYQPGHHPDEAFHHAAKNGVPSHHWRFGNMPPVDGVSEPISLRSCAIPANRRRRTESAITRT
jgi:hypothetical protein